MNTIEHAMSFQYGGMSFRELTYLSDLCINQVVLELGSMVGMSSYVIASVAKSLDCVDVWNDNQDHLQHDPIQQGIYAQFGDLHIYDTFIQNCKEFIDPGKIKMHRGLTSDRVIDFANRAFDIILFDADHSYPGIMNDYLSYKDKLKKDGIFIFHDYGDSMWTGVKVFCDEVVERNELQFVDSLERLAIFKCVIQK